MADRWLKAFLDFGLPLICLVAFGLAATLYFLVCRFTLGLVYAQSWRPGSVHLLQRQGLDPQQADARLLGQDRGVALARAAIALAAAWLFYRYA
jgi:hypothetical protein